MGGTASWPPHCHSAPWGLGAPSRVARSGEVSRQHEAWSIEHCIAGTILNGANLKKRGTISQNKGSNGCRSSKFTQWASRRLLGVAAAFTDVTLVFKDEQPLIAHSVILSETRPFLRNILNKNNHYHLLIYMSTSTSRTLYPLL